MIDFDLYVKKILKKTIYDLMVYSDSDQFNEVCERSRDVAGAMLYDNICINKLSLKDKMNLIFKHDLKFILKHKGKRVTKEDVHLEFDALIFQICEDKLIKLGVMEPDNIF